MSCSEEDSDSVGSCEEEELCLDGQGRILIEGPKDCMDYDFQAYHGALCLNKPSALKQLVEDCKGAFGWEETFWLGADASPRCALETLAGQVFQAHTAAAHGAFDRSTSGAEWWVQVREDGHQEESIGLHWDKDEALVDEQGMNVHPHLSTVTYLSNFGAPTLVLEKTTPIDYHDFEEMYEEIPQGFVSHPKLGKHIAFDGRFLHGVPTALKLRRAGHTSARGAPSVKGPTPSPSKSFRITFLVNIWLNYHPSNCQAFPEEELHRVSGGDASAVQFALQHRHTPPLLAMRASSIRSSTLEFFFGPTWSEHVVSVPFPTSILEDAGVTSSGALATGASSRANDGLEDGWDTLGLVFKRGNVAAVRPAPEKPKNTTGKARKRRKMR